MPNKAAGVAWWLKSSPNSSSHMGSTGGTRACTVGRCLCRCCVHGRGRFLFVYPVHACAGEAMSRLLLLLPRCGVLPVRSRRGEVHAPRISVGLRVNNIAVNTCCIRGYRRTPVAYSLSQLNRWVVRLSLMSAGLVSGTLCLAVIGVMCV